MKRRSFLKYGLTVAGGAMLPAFAARTDAASSAKAARTLSQVKPEGAGGLYAPNRAPLHPSAFMKLPIGSIHPSGWMREQLENQAEGLNGRMMEVSDYLDIHKSGWIIPANDGFEELGYWLRGFAPLGYMLGNSRIIQATAQWVKGIIATQKPDGWFGPTRLRTSMDGGPDMWPHMPILYAVRNYHEYTGDSIVIPFMTQYFRYQTTQDPKVFGGGWGGFRWGDNIDSIYWLYNQTGDVFLLDLIKSIHAHSAPYTTEMPTYHNVNLSQGFREPAQYSMLDNDPKYVRGTERVYDTIMGMFGQFPGGGFAGDEGCRPGFVDPRQGFETCGIAELMLSFEILTRITGDPKWADRCEELAFNSLPAALDPNQKGTHYVTSANSPSLMSEGAKHRQYDDSPMGMQTYKPGVHDYRCCPHNYGMAWPMYAENLWLATADGGLCAAMYAPNSVTAKVAGGIPVTIVQETEYPFRDTITLNITPQKPVSFPLILRVPEWCDSPTVRVNGVTEPARAKGRSYLILERFWRGGDVVVLHLPMRTAVHKWAGNKDAVSVSHGPLHYSLAIQEKWVRSGGTDHWPEYDLHPMSPWNYGLILDPANPAHSFDLIQKGRAITGNPFTHEDNPVELRVNAKRIPQWQVDGDGVASMLQASPAISQEITERIGLIPMGAARLRLTTFPTIATSSDGHLWRHAPTYVATVKSSNDNNWPWTPQCLLYDAQPSSSKDLRTPRMSFQDSRPTEWIQYKLPKPVRISKALIYWFEDAGDRSGWYPFSGEFHAPKSWRLEYRDGASWKPVRGVAAYGVALDRPNIVDFDPIVASSLRLTIDTGNRPVSLYRWDVFDGDTQLVPTVSEKAISVLGPFATGPRSIGGAPVVWLEAGKIEEIADGGAVNNWYDQSPNAVDALSSGEAAPTFAAGAIHGHAAVRFSAVHKQYLIFDRPVQDDFTIAVLFQSTQGVSDSANYFQGAGLVQGEVGGETEDFGLALNAKGQVIAGVGNPDTSIASLGGFNDGKPHLAIFQRVRSTGVFTLFVDGTMAASGVGATKSLTAPATLGVGAQSNGANCFTGDIGEVVIYDRALSQEDRKALEERLTAQWGPLG
ncbi:hypothetical protein CCAX7_32350 [Capsulimonas corticalis]|uniref:Uncharacterized protein n=1 Tax=Capsulimonas corticalis TaxID=2219043 RepID=A0A402D467_9BACT|nr:beta-L-arabinofuranosidase domain-containing protein [Capsulimonas corticalis]BDI31184.1 hypothetical protein CCAX7_32350 [Capsulimonas corticalis]